MLNAEITDQLTDEQCDEFRSMPGSFREMVRQIYKAGFYKGGLATLAKIDPHLDDAIAQLGPEECNNCDLAQSALEGARDALATA